MDAVIKFFVELVSKASILIGLVAMIGLIAQGKPFGAVVAGTVKTTLGFLILGAGAGVVISAISPLGNLTQTGFGLQGALPVNEVFVAIAQEKLGAVIGYVFAISFILSVILARFTPLKYIFLSGHHILFMSVLTVGILGIAVIKDPTTLVIVCSIITGISFLTSAWVSDPYMKAVTGGDDIVMGHFGTGSYVLGGYLGLLFGDRKKSTEDVNVPEWLGFMKEPLVAMTVVMWLFFLIASVAALLVVGSPGLAEIYGNNESWVLNSLMSALTFAAGIGVILLGVRMILADIVPAFRGFAEKIVPGAKAALDCPVVFPYAPNAVLIGYLTSIVGGLLAMGLQIVANGALGAVIIPSMIIHFFLGATSAVYGNATGGMRGAVLGGFFNGIVFTLLAGTAYVGLGQLGFSNSTFGDTGFGMMGSALSFIAALLTP